MPKGILILNILDILRRYSDENHRLSQKDIADILQKEYDMTADRKSVRRNLLNLIDGGYNIEYSEISRTVTNKSTGESEQTEILTDFYLERDFTDGELRLLIDSLLFSMHIPQSQCETLLKKLESLASVHFKSRVKHIHKTPSEKADNKQLFYNIEMLDEAISRNRQVSFYYLEYGTDKKLHRRKAKDGKARLYIINPYQMAAKEGKYYLICNYDKYDAVSNYRIDRIADIKILDSPIKPFETLGESGGKRLDLAAYMEEHAYMYSSENSRVTLRVSRAMISDVIDLFGGGVTFSDEDEKSVSVSVYTNERAAEQFAYNFSPDVTVLEPQSLREKIKQNLKQALENYL